MVALVWVGVSDTQCGPAPHACNPVCALGKPEPMRHIECMSDEHANAPADAGPQYRARIPERQTSTPKSVENAAASEASAKNSAVAAPANGPKELGGPKGPEPTRFGDWERDGRCVDF